MPATNNHSNLTECLTSPIFMTPKQSRAQLSKTADWVTNLSMQSTYTANLSKN